MDYVCEGVLLFGTSNYIIGLDFAHILDETVNQPVEHSVKNM